jgi:hypothetical protein
MENEMNGLVPMKAIPVLRRSMGTKMTPGGKVVICTVCSWWSPMMGRNTGAAAKEFGSHICTEHPPVKGSQNPSNPK